jgi:hypothetical protein
VRPGGVYKFLYLGPLPYKAWAETWRVHAHPAYKIKNQNICMYISLDANKDCDLLHDGPVLSSWLQPQFGHESQMGSTQRLTDWLTGRQLSSDLTLICTPHFLHSLQTGQHCRTVTELQLHLTHLLLFVLCLSEQFDLSLKSLVPRSAPQIIISSHLV